MSASSIPSRVEFRTISRNTLYLIIAGVIPLLIILPTKLITPSGFATPKPAPTDVPTEAPPAPSVPLVITDDKGVTMRLVPAGPFTMGRDKGGGLAQFVHTVTLDAYYMDVYEVTNSLYKSCVDAGSCTPPLYSSSFTRTSYYGNSSFDNYPVIYVDWDQAKAYCEWRGARLSTEAEWEKAARGTDARIYPWGNTDPTSSLLNYNANVGDTTEVGSYESGKSPYGMFDMAGNVFEWVGDWDDDGNYYQNSPLLNPQGPSNGTLKLTRGGSWEDNMYVVVSSARYGRYPTSRDFNLGFRCSRNANP